MSTRKSSLSAQARSTLLTAIAAFVGLQLALATAIETRLPQLRDPLYGDKLLQLKNRIAESPAESPLVVMLGSSRTVHGLDAETLEREMTRRQRRQVVAYNFGLPGAGTFTQLVCLRRLFDEGIHPDLMMIEILAPVLSGLIPPHEFEQYPADRIWRSDIPLIERYTREAFPERKLAVDWWRGWWTPFYTHRFAIMRKISPAFVPSEGRSHLFAQFDPRGWNAMPQQIRTVERYEAALTTARREYAAELSDFVLGGPSCQALREMLEICQAEGTPVALVVMPEGDEFRSWYPPGAWQQIDSFLQALSDEFAAPIINGREWIAEDDFLDSHHLLAPGAARFSRRLAQSTPPADGHLQQASKKDHKSFSGSWLR